MFIPDPDIDFYSSLIPDPGVKKAPDSGSATLDIPICISGNAKIDPQVEAECLKQNQEWEAWKRKNNVTHYKPAKIARDKASSPSSSTPKPSPSTKGKAGGKRGLKTGGKALTGGRGNKFEARLAKQGKNKSVILS